MRGFVTIVSLFVCVSVEAQTAETWLRRWHAEQNEASVTLARLRLTETTEHDLDGAGGPLSLTIESALIVDRASGTVSRNPYRVRSGDKEIDSGDRRRRRLQSPVRRDLLRAADELLFPESALAGQRVVTEVDTDRLDGREVTRIHTAARSEDSPIERITWFFSRPQGRLVRARAIVRGEDRGTLAVEVSYDRVEGLDLPVSRTLEGSFASRRRTRTYTIFVDSRAQYTLTALESL